MVVSCSTEEFSPSCSICERASRLVNLWDILNHFDASSLGYMLSRLGNLEAAYQTQKWDGHGAVLASVDSQTLDSTKALLGSLSFFFKRHDMPRCLQYADQSAYHISRLGTDVSTMASQLYNLKVLLIKDLQEQKFLRVADDRFSYIDTNELFGDAVKKAFPSSTQDVKEASNCLGIECNTAAVFHLMRAAEIALRVLALDRGVSYPNSSVDDQQCGVLIVSLDTKLKDLRAADKKLWPSESIKSEQIRFYHAASIELRSFNEAWRKHVAHAGYFYDRDEAVSIFNHVRKFMQILAPKISEVSVTPEYWISS